MKKVVSSLAIVLAGITASAQGFYLRLGMGYDLPQAGQTMDGTATPYNGSRNATTYVTTYNIKVASFASGMWGSLAGGYMFNDNVGAELAANIGMNMKKYTFTDENSPYAAGAVENLEQQANTPILLMPSLVLQTNSESALNIYGRLGIAIPLNTKITEDEVFVFSYAGQPVVDDYTSQISNSFSLGYNAALGVKYKVSDKVSVWGEVSMLSMSLFIKQMKLTSVSENGYSIPLDSVSGPHTVKFSRTATVDTSATTQAAYSQPFSNIGFHFGVIFNFGDNSRHSHGRRSDDEDIDHSKPFRRR
jgi:opacity protein-like surface antigen